MIYKDNIKSYHLIYKIFLGFYIFLVVNNQKTLSQVPDLVHLKTIFEFLNTSLFLMKKYFLITLILFSYFLQAQSIKVIDSLNVEICKSLVQNKNLNNEIRIKTITNLHILPYLSRFKDTIVQKQAFAQIFYRLHKNCNQFVALFPDKSDESSWGIQYEKPTETISKEQCIDFNTFSNYYYIENDGNKVEVTLKDHLWIEKFSDNTFSKLHYRKKGNCEFELEFIESNNLSRKNMSIKGDKYLYKLYHAEDETYSIYMKNNETYYTFKVIKQ